MSTLITNAKIVNEGMVFDGDVLIVGDRIQRIDSFISTNATCVIDAQGKWLLPGVIDDQVHFREPGLTHKGNIFSESRAAVAGGVTSYMEMPNTIPPTLTQKLLEEKYAIASRHSIANYSFYMGASNNNIDEVMKTDLNSVCGLKIFMGSTTGNLLVDSPSILETFFSSFSGLIATHCEDEPTIRKNTNLFQKQFGADISMKLHPSIRSAEACFIASSHAVALANQWGTRLHILHISTAKEISLFDSTIPLQKKKITAEVCVHHLWFNEIDYSKLGTKIKWNPSIKSQQDQQALFEALLDGHLDIVATDHAPHTLLEKQNSYFNVPSGGPLIQHSLVAMLDFVQQKKIDIKTVVQKMCHNPAILFRIVDRGYIREGCFADLVLVDMNVPPWIVGKENILSSCGWSPFEGQSFKSQIDTTIVSGRNVFMKGKINEAGVGQRLKFWNI